MSKSSEPFVCADCRKDRVNHYGPCPHFAGTSDVPMPTDEEMDAFRRGEEAFNRGSPEDANPYEDHRATMWGFGWISGQVDARKGAR